ncbi:MAG: hypothetical protein ABSG43_23275 [Solirubrobacteraceae bacterium]
MKPADHFGATRDADVRLLVEIAPRNITGEATSHKTLSNDLDRLERGDY